MTQIWRIREWFFFLILLYCCFLLYVCLCSCHQERAAAREPNYPHCICKCNWTVEQTSPFCRPSEDRQWWRHFLKPYDSVLLCCVFPALSRDLWTCLRCLELGDFQLDLPPLDELPDFLLTLFLKWSAAGVCHTYMYALLFCSLWSLLCFVSL